MHLERLVTEIDKYEVPRSYASFQLSIYVLELKPSYQLYAVRNCPWLSPS